jgi:hypothetical protein
MIVKTGNPKTQSKFKNVKVNLKKNASAQNKT